ncbi:MAG: LuxR C-terminal-related transcriptional regulator, partial [Aureibaculum sp.]
DIVITNDANPTMDQKTKTIQKFDEPDQQPTKINIYKPVVIILIVLLVAIVLYQIYVINKLREKNKLEEYQDNIEKYNTQQIMLANELKMASNANIKLGKEIEAKEIEQKKIALSIIRKNEILSKLKAEIETLKLKPEGKFKYSDLNNIKLLIHDNLNIENERKSFNNYIKELNNSFLNNLVNKYPTLTENDKKLCSLLRLNLSTKEMASILDITPKSVEVNRSRLRKKMNIKKKENLNKIIRKL